MTPSPTTASTRIATSLRDSLQLPPMNADERLGFREMQAAFREPLTVPTFLLGVLGMTAFLGWDIAREGGWGPGANTRLAGAALCLVLLAAMRRWWKAPVRLQGLAFYVAMYVWQLAEGRTMAPDPMLQFPGLLIIMFASVLALMHARDAWINLPLAALSVPLVLPDPASLAQWLYVTGLFSVVMLLVWINCAQRERTSAVIFLSKAQWKRDAQTDVVTGLANRRTFEAAMAREAWRLHANPASLTLAIIDIDHFKSVNDRYGHDVGDQVLREVAARLRAHVRDVDVLARLGGEEFGLVMLGMPRVGVAALLGRLRSAVEARPFVVGGQTVPCTISAGFTVAAAGDSHWEALYQRADQALYEAKARGRNQVVDVSAATAR